MSLNTIAVSNSAVNTASVNSVEFRVDTVTGEAYISQRQAARELGVPNTSLQYYLENILSRAGNYDTSQGLSSEIFGFTVQYYALEARNPTDEAKSLLKKITSAGVKAYLYTRAGYVINASLPPAEPVVPSNALLPIQVAKIELDVYRDVLEMLGVTGNAAILGANQATVKTTGIDLLERVGHKHLLQPEQLEVLNVTDLGKRVGLTARQTNLKLRDLGLQVQIGGSKWTLTDAGQVYGKLLDTSKKQINGTPVLQLKWLVSVLDLF